MPESASLALERAGTSVARGELWAAANQLRQALASSERLGESWAGAVKLATQIADDHAAVLAARRLYEESSKGPAEAFILAEALTQASQPDEAADLLVPLADTGVLSPEQHFKLTRMLMFAGRLDEAQARSRALL